MLCRMCVISLLALMAGVAMSLTSSGSANGEQPSAVQAEKPLRIESDQARKHLGKLVIAKFTVRHTKFSVSGQRVYLDSTTDYRSPENLGVVIEKEDLKTFELAGIQEPDKHFAEKLIEVTGKPFIRDETVFIQIRRPDQIRVIRTDPVKAPGT